MALKDSDIKKWEYSEHAKVKHLLLRKYLPAWITILGSFKKRLCYFDGFAGRGEYSDGSLGSPILALNAMEEVYNNTKVRNFEFNCFFIENDEDNYNNLKEIVENLKSDYPSVNYIECIHSDFDTKINEILDQLEKNNKKLAPSFFFIDPFGFTGVNFNTIRRILSQPKTEIFLNFMVRDVNRFLGLSNQEGNMNILFGNEKWKQLLDFKGKERQIALRDLYIDNLIDSGAAKYVWPFRISEDNRCATLYYLIYATNHFRGLDAMKTIMYNQNEHFAYLGPDEHVYQMSKNQLKFIDFDKENLKTYLLNTYNNVSKTYEQIKEETYMETPCICKHYRAALKELEKEGKVKITRVSSKKTGLKGEDIVHF